jgi:hypothetical protein
MFAATDLVKAIARNYKDATTILERRVALSYLSTVFTLDFVNEFVFEKELRPRRGLEEADILNMVSRKEWHAARSDMLQYGAGNSVLQEVVYPTYQRTRYDFDAVEKAFRFSADHLVQDTSYGAHTAAYTNGMTILLPSSIRKYDLTECWDKYTTYCTYSDISPMKREHFIFIMQMVGPQGESLLGALDSVYIKCGLRNFEKYRELILFITKGNGALQDQLLELTLQVELYIKRGLGTQVG